MKASQHMSYLKKDADKYSSGESRVDRNILSFRVISR
jgi:hypothetical protein